MTQWPAARWCEWWDAQQGPKQNGFRRTRAYGILYAMHKKKWHKATLQQRRNWCEWAGVKPYHAGSMWCDIGKPDMRKKDREKIKVKLRKAMSQGKPTDHNATRWIGRVKFTRGAGYSVDLIQGDNFSRSRRGSGDNYAAAASYVDPGGGKA